MDDFRLFSDEVVMAARKQSVGRRMHGTILVVDCAHFWGVSAIEANRVGFVLDRSFGRTVSVVLWPTTLSRSSAHKDIHLSLISDDIVGYRNRFSSRRNRTPHGERL